MHKIITRIILMVLYTLTLTTTSFASYQVDIEISTPDSKADTGLASNKLHIGTDRTATDGYDNKFDTLALFALSEGTMPLQAYLYHPEYSSGQQKLWGDFRGESFPQEWEFEVLSEENSLININWLINAPANLKFNLIDLNRNQEIAMASSNKYSFSNSTSVPKKFLLKVSEDTTGIN